MVNLDRAMKNESDRVPAESTSRARAKLAMGWTTAIGLAFGTFLLFYVLRKYNFREVLAAVATAGWGIALISAFRAVTLATDAVGWRELWLRSNKPSNAKLLVYRWIGESVNSLLPVAQVGGHVARARLLGRSQGNYVAAGAATIVDLTIGVLTQAVYTVVGIALLLPVARANGSNLNSALLLVAALLIIGVVALYLIQRGRMMQKVARLIQSVLAGSMSAMADQLHSGAQAIDSAIQETYDRHGALLRSIGWRMFTWLLQTGETWMIMYFLGAPVNWASAIILESLGTAVRNAAFPVPAGLGAQEGGFLLLGAALGIPPPLCLALSLVKRARELIVGLPALATLAWLESRKTAN
jgi:putative membrane protein